MHRGGARVPVCASLLCAALALTAPATTPCSAPLALGFDFGTSGLRSCVVTSQEHSIVHESSLLWTDLPSAGAVAAGEDPAGWSAGLQRCVDSIPMDLRARVHSIAVSGTSSTALLGVAEGARFRVTRETCMYDYSVTAAFPSQGGAALDLIRAACPPGSAANAAASTLAKLVTWHLRSPLEAEEQLLHQADYVALLLTDTIASDWNNALKLGFDVVTLSYPPWLTGLLAGLGVAAPLTSLLPPVIEPGRTIGVLSAHWTDMGFPHDCQVVGGTTDSIAAFIASGASEVGQGVTSLGSTLAIKLLSAARVEDSTRGVYSHRIRGCQWLVGGASNVGCRVLREQGFSGDELVALSAEIDPGVDSPLRYYPLCRPGERFPVADPAKQPCLEPRPASRAAFLHGILQGISTVECDAYAALEALGASPLREVLTAGGGARNEVWTAMRARRLGVRALTAVNSDAAFGAALLADMYPSQRA